MSQHDPSADVAPVVLLVDDSADSRGGYAYFLGIKGWRVIEADCGRDGLRLAARHRPQVVVVDVQLPDLDGYAVTRALKAEPETASICVIVLSGREREEMKARVHEAGANGFIVKPSEPAELLAEMHRCSGLGPPN